MHSSSIGMELPNRLNIQQTSEVFTAFTASVPVSLTLSLSLSPSPSSSFSYIISLFLPLSYVAPLSFIIDSHFPSLRLIINPGTLLITFPFSFCSVTVYTHTTYIYIRLHMYAYLLIWPTSLVNHVQLHFIRSSLVLWHFRSSSPTKWHNMFAPPLHCLPPFSVGKVTPLCTYTHT